MKGLDDRAAQRRRAWKWLVGATRDDQLDGGGEAGRRLEVGDFVAIVLFKFTTINSQTCMDLNISRSSTKSSTGGKGNGPWIDHKMNGKF